MKEFGTRGDCTYILMRWSYIFIFSKEISIHLLILFSSLSDRKYHDLAYIFYLITLFQNSTEIFTTTKEKEYIRQVEIMKLMKLNKTIPIGQAIRCKLKRFVLCCYVCDSGKGKGQ